jgi:glycosyltransferase involved in cell wall biosynthesis
VELARRFRGADFLMLGQAHFAGSGSWLPTDVPDNVQLLGHVDGDSKRRALASSWIVVNTSIHEALSVALLEALHCGTPIVSCLDPEQVTSRFGLYAGRWDGDGLDGLDVLSDAIARLLDDDDLRLRLGNEGREWARRTHTREQFLAAFARLTESFVPDGG